MPWNISDAEEKDADLCAALDDLSEVTQGWVEVMETAIHDNFTNEKAGQKRWEPLAASTLSDRKSKGFAPGPILERTGNLKNASTEIKKSDGTSAEVGFPDDHP